MAIGAALALGALGTGIGSLLSLGGRTEQVSGPTTEELRRLRESARRAGIARIQEQANISRAQVGAQIESAGTFDSGASIAGATRVQESASRAISDLESNLAREFIQGLAQQRFASVPTATSVLGQALARTGGSFTQLGILGLTMPMFREAAGEGFPGTDNQIERALNIRTAPPDSGELSMGRLASENAALAGAFDRRWKELGSPGLVSGERDLLYNPEAGIFGEYESSSFPGMRYRKTLRRDGLIY